MGWVSRLFDARDTLVRMVLLDLSGVSYLVVGTEGRAPTTLQWILAGLAFGCALIFYRRPVLSLLAQAILLALSFWLLDDPMISQVGTGWMLLRTRATSASSTSRRSTVDAWLRSTWLTCTGSTAAASRIDEKRKNQREAEKRQP